MNIAEILADKIQELKGEETVVSDLTYDLRSGAPDFVDRMVAATFAGMAVDLIAKGEHGLMMAINQGCYAAVPIPDPKLGPRKLDVAKMYNTDRYRPSYATRSACRSSSRTREAAPGAGTDFRAAHSGCIESGVAP